MHLTDRDLQGGLFDAPSAPEPKPAGASATLCEGRGFRLTMAATCLGYAALHLALLQCWHATWVTVPLYCFLTGYVLGVGDRRREVRELCGGRAR